MDNKLEIIIKKNSKLLSEMNISVDEIKNTELNFKDSAEQVDLIGEKAFTRITLFENNRLYIQVLNINTEETIYIFDDVFEKDLNLEEFIFKAIRKMLL